MTTAERGKALSQGNLGTHESTPPQAEFVKTPTRPSSGEKKVHVPKETLVTTGIEGQGRTANGASALDRTLGLRILDLDEGSRPTKSS
jgi:hypothetical protein